MADVYIEETGAGDGDIKITVEGEEYTAEANYDLDADGIDETVAVMTDEGHVAYIDENADGAADLMQTVDPGGRVVEQARFDSSTGQWVGEEPAGQTQEEPRDRGGESLVVDTVQGDLHVGPATEDTNEDGRADTAIVDMGENAVLVTDFDGDGAADQIVDLDESGGVTISHRTGDAEWTVVEEGRIDSSGQYAPTPGSGATADAVWTFDDESDAPAPMPVKDPRPGADSDSLWR